MKLWRVIAESEGLSMCVFVGDETSARLVCDRIVGTPLRMAVIGGGERTIGDVVRAELVESDL